jgi:hypothetical protein
MPSTAMRAADEIARLELLLHAVIMRNPQDNPGQRLNSGYSTFV